MVYKYTITKTFNGPPCLCSLIGVLFDIGFFFFRHLTSTCFFVRVRASTIDVSGPVRLWTGPHLFLYLGGLVRVMAPEPVGAAVLLRNVELVSCSANVATSEL